ncbi:protein-glucosylgalactosylhydroxylysine glucosidase [Eurosta solidaginis]|uniref:protein-glucosylgalactosylhydroxylysine glucosidase n=1 Tax=Eurosta solidaginis TaxID=178769 RepID=UPI0035307EF4
MQRQMTPIVVLGIFLLILASALYITAEDSVYKLKTEKLPTDLNFMPILGNGHLGYTVFGDAIYMNGIYNGEAGNSRRARIPNWLNLSVSRLQYEEWELNIIPDTYELNLKDGYFRWLFAYEANGLHVQLEQRTYPHRYYNRALIYELFVHYTGAFDPLLIHLSRKPGSKSDAFDFSPLGTNSSTFGTKMLRGVTRQLEHPDFQSELRTIFVAFSDDWENELSRTFELPAGQEDFYYRYVMTADGNEKVARKEMEDVMTLTIENLLKKHTNEWHNFWLNFNIQIDGSIELSQTINAGIFYLANSLPSLHTKQPNDAYFGLSPTGLGRGQLDTDYEGHSFWDTEIWMLPTVTQLNTDWADQLFEYRFDHMSGARYNANKTGYRGARFPWESAYTGTDVTNPCCPEISTQEIHISPDIIFALQQHYAVTHSTEWLCRVAWPMGKEVADFLVSRVYDDGQKYHIKDVMGPDEDHANVTDNVYTNVVTKKALEFTSFVRPLCTENFDPPANWLDIAQRLHILYDESLDFHPQHFGYERGEIIKQADVILLGYPLQYQMDNSTRLNDLNIYEPVTRASGPAMSWSMFAINFLDVGEIEKANKYFQRGYKDYVRPEFKVWSENRMGFVGSANFLTGIGGFLQAIINGYGGIRFHLHDAGHSVMEVRKAHLIADYGFIINGIKFANSTFALKIHKNGTTLCCLKKGSLDIEFLVNAEVYKINDNFTINIVDNAAFIRTI